MVRVFPGVLEETSVSHLRSMLEKAEFEDGSTTAGAWGETIKRNGQLPRAEAKALAATILTVFDDPQIRRWILPTSATQPTFNRYRAGDRYGRHVDAAVQGGLRADLSYTLFLSPPEAYDGGELRLEMAGQELLYKETAGSLVVYPAGTPHEVRAVTRGVRYAAVGWIQSGVADVSQRQLLYKFQDALMKLHQKNQSGPEFTALTEVYGDLLRLWFR